MCGTAITARLAAPRVNPVLPPKTPGKRSRSSSSLTIEVIAVITGGDIADGSLPICPRAGWTIAAPQIAARSFAVDFPQPPGPPGVRDTNLTPHRRKCRVSPDRSPSPRPDLSLNRLQSKPTSRNLSPDRTGSGADGYGWVALVDKRFDGQVVRTNVDTEHVGQDGRAVRWVRPMVRTW
jgi:hypothetical protein